MLRRTLKSLKLLIVDEVSMISSITLLYMHLRLTEIMANNDYFGGKSVVFFADFLQLLLVKGNQPFIPVSFFEAKQLLGAIASVDLWSIFSYEELIIDMRQNGDLTYGKMFSDIWVRRIDDTSNTILCNRFITPGRRAIVPEVCEKYNSLLKEGLSPSIYFRVRLNVTRSTMLFCEELDLLSSI